MQYNTNNTNLDKKIIPFIYPGKKGRSLSDCDYLFFENNKYIVCNIKEFEVNYFKKDFIDFNTNNLFYSKLCGIQKPAFFYIFQLDKTKYPIFYVQKLILPDEEELSFSSKFILEGKIEGSLSEYNSNINNNFSIIINIEMKSKNNISYIIDCSTNSFKEITNFKFECRLNTKSTIKKNIVLNFIFCHILFEI